MKISDLFNDKQPTFSFEFFPAKTEKGFESLSQTIEELAPLNPSYVSVTYGAGGGSRDLTKNLVASIQNEMQINTVAHLTCVNASKDETKEVLDFYHEHNIENILALRGDPPKGQERFTADVDGFEYAAELVAFTKKHYPNMSVGVAGFPEGHFGTPNRQDEMAYLKAKVDAGADYICTQLFFDNRDFYDFAERCEIAGIHVPIVAGIMPITSIANFNRIPSLALGARYPAKLLKAIQRADTDEQVSNVGTHWATSQALDLINNGVAGVHFYTLNRSKATQKIYKYVGMC